VVWRLINAAALRSGSALSFDAERGDLGVGVHHPYFPRWSSKDCVITYGDMWMMAVLYLLAWSVGTLSVVT
jgi:hypothetical protein